MKKHWLRIIIYALLIAMIACTGHIVIKARNFYGITLHDLARVGDTSTKEVSELCKTVVQIDSGSGNGSGVILFADKYFMYILTNYHVIRNLDRETANVKFISSGIDYCVKNPVVISYEVTNDIAILCINNIVKDFRIAELAEEEPKTGDEIFTIGFPMGITHFCSKGVYTKTNSTNSFRSDMTTAPGASGSPVFNSDGKVVGLVKALNYIPIPKSKFWEKIARKKPGYYLVRYSISVNLSTILKFLENIANAKK